MRGDISMLDSFSIDEIMMIGISFKILRTRILGYSITFLKAPAWGPVHP